MPPHGITASGMQVGHSGHTQHLRQFGGGFELLDGSPLYPCVGIGDDGDVVVWNGIAHVVLLSCGRKKRRLFFQTAAVARNDGKQPDAGGRDAADLPQ